MLDDREQRILQDLERQLADVDPGREHGLHRRRIPWWPTSALAVGLVVGIFLMALGVVGHALLLVAVAAVPMGRWWWQHRRGDSGGRPGDVAQG